MSRVEIQTLVILYGIAIFVAFYYFFFNVLKLKPGLRYESDTRFYLNGAHCYAFQ